MTRGLFAMALAASLGCSLVCPQLAGQAFAETTTYARSGPWSAFGGRADDGRKICGIYATGGGRYFTMKYLKGNHNLTLQLSKTNWRVTDGESVAVKLTIDEEDPWEASATGFHFNDGDSGLELAVSIKSLGKWLREFSDGNAMAVEFPDSDISGWSVDLRGTADIVQSFAQCVSNTM